jgi:aminoglycoside phosphotransferase (APT) family kinase protein
VIDFGSCGIGDPACDVVIAWTFFDDTARRRFRAALEVDADTWARGRGWALWKALIGLRGRIENGEPGVADLRRAIARIAA